MAWQLFRLGRWSFLHRKLVVVVWLALLAAGVLGATTLDTKTTEGFTLTGIESTEAFDLIAERSGTDSGESATARMVFEAPEGQALTTPENRRVIADAIAATRTDHVMSATDPFTAGTVSENGRAAYSTITYTTPAIDITEADLAALDSGKAIVDQAGLNSVVGGDAVAAQPGPSVAEVIGIGVGFVVLVITFGSLVAAGMPMLTALIGVGIGMLGITTLSAFVELSSVTSALGTMLGLAVGIDYALFIMSRYQDEVRKGRSLEDAAGTAVGTAGGAVIFAGLTVVIALAGLSVCGIGFLTQMGLGGAAMVIIAVLVALTLLPAVLGFAGQKVLKGKIKGLRSRSSDTDDRTNGRRWVDGISKYKVPALIGGLLLAAVISIPVASMELALPDDGVAPSGSDSRVAFDVIADNFGAGANGPLVVVVDTASAADPVQAVNTAVEKINAIGTDVSTVVPPDATALGQQLSAVQFTTITVIPDSAPSDVATKDLVSAIRSALSDLPAQTDGARALVTGQTAVGVDISQSLTDVFPLYLAVVVGLAFILLMIVFRSILVPIKAALGFLLSVGISLGTTVAVFQWGWLGNLIGLDTTSPIIFILPLLLTGVLFGLAMDYEVFLVTRMREAYVHGTPAKQAVVIGFQHSARVVTAAAIIMFGVFAGFALTDQVIIKTIGFGLAVGVLADAFLVRMTIVPALMAIVGDKMWWLPGWLNRILPNVDIEGESLQAHRGTTDTQDDRTSVGVSN